jgi:hypothetical protein
MRYKSPKREERFIILSVSGYRRYFNYYSRYYDLVRGTGRYSFSHVNSQAAVPNYGKRISVKLIM